MYSIQDFLKDQQGSIQKKESIDQLMKESDIQDFLNRHQLGRSFVENHWIDFLDLQQDHAVCQSCQKLAHCPKSLKGYRRFLALEEGILTSYLEPCQYGQVVYDTYVLLSHVVVKNVHDSLLTTSFENLSYDQPKVKDVAKLLMRYCLDKGPKGFYLHGSPGTGKSMLMGALIQALAHQGCQCGYICFPTFMSELKDNIAHNQDDDRVALMKEVDYLVLDDIGQENITAWSRDDILGAILLERSQRGLPTFFTSVYSMEELQKAYRLSKGKNDEVKVARMILKMKTITQEIAL